LKTERTTPRLSSTVAASRLPYDRSSVTPGIVHLGVGAFCRAHLAAYVDDVLRSDPSWGIVGASLRRSVTRDALAPQDFLYTLAVRDGSGASSRVVGSIIQILDAATQRRDLLAAMVDPRVRIVSLTVTEKGYCHDPATGELDPHHPYVLHDLAHPEAPVSVPGLVVQALELRRAAGMAPFTVLCCDNLPENGRTTARVVTGFARLRDKGLADYIAAEVAFPSTMVDRIVPATTEADRKLILDATGMDDAWPVVTEPFTQWVIEDRFPGGRPALETVGAELVADVRPFELMKLRMLNGSHSTIAYLGYLGGYEHVNEAMADPSLRTLIHQFMTDEVMSTLPGGLRDLAVYRDALLERFGNPALRHRTWQIAMDGSQKLPQRLLGTIRERLALGLPVRRAALGVAAWMRYVTGVDERGNKIDVRDPLASRLQGVSKSSDGRPDRLVDGLLGVAEIFGEDLHRHEGFRAELVGHLTMLLRRGALETVRVVNHK
jgi:fructuronate reductase